MSIVGSEIPGNRVTFSFHNYSLKLAKHRTFRALIGVEGGGYMLESKAKSRVDQGRAIIVNGLVRFLKADQHPGYDAAPGYASFSGRVSFDPELGGGPQVVQYYRPRPPRERRNKSVSGV